MRHPIRMVMIGLALVLGVGCSKIGGQESVKAPPTATPYTLPVRAYLSLANRQVGDERSALLIMAAGRAIYEGQVAEGVQLLGALPDLPPVLHAEKMILLAKVSVLQHRSTAAVEQLASVKNVQTLSLFYQTQYHLLLADSYRMAGRFAEAVGERILLAPLLSTPAERLDNTRMLWLVLMKLPAAEINTMVLEGPQTPEWQGWLRLAAIAKASHLSRDELLARLQAWQKMFPQHPAASLLSGVGGVDVATLYPAVHQVALLLPLSGPLAGPGHAIEEGFMAAMSAGGAAPLQVKTYDTNSNDVQALYHDAIEAGADFVVGPLAKADVATVAGLPHPVPTILLNDVSSKATPNTYWFGLSPAAEAKQVALKAGQQGYRRALVIVPKGAWGDDVLAGFFHAWRRQGGVMVDALRYDESTDLSPAVRNLLQADDEHASRREDVDMIFLVAYPSRAREIVPLLRYYYAASLPIFSTSAVYAGSEDSKQDRDLDGVIFCDMPFVFNQQMPNKHWPEQLNSYSRLYALGMDSYALTYQLNILRLLPVTGVDAASGLVYLTSTNQLIRVLTWGQFRQGRVVRWSEG